MVGVEAESGGEVFKLESNAVVLSVGALKSPHILMLSGIGPKDQLEESGIPVVQPSINYRYFRDDNDIRRMRDAVRLACSIVDSPAYEGVSDGRIIPTDEALDWWIRTSIGSSRHVSGTCKIGPDSDPMSVVDQQCRVRGVSGIWVADSSIMPRVTRANTNATAIMTGERVADWVAQAT